MLTLRQLTCYVDLRHLTFTFNILHVEARTHRTDAEELAALPGHLFRLLWLARWEKHLACNICNVLHISWNANLILWTCAVLAWQQSSVTLTFNNVSTLHVSTYTWSQLASEHVVLALISKFTRNFQCLLVLAPPLNRSGTTPAGVVPLLFKGGAGTNKPTNAKSVGGEWQRDRRMILYDIYRGHEPRGNVSTRRGSRLNHRRHKQNVHTGNT